MSGVVAVPAGDASPRSPQQSTLHHIPGDSGRPYKINRQACWERAHLPGGYMTNNSSSVVQNDVPTTPAPVPAAGPYADAVTAIQAALDAIVAAIPATPLKQQSTVKYVRRRQGVKPELIAKAVTAAQTAPVLQSLLDVPDARDTLAFGDAFRPI